MFTALLLVAAALRAGAQDPAPELFAFVGVHVVPMDEERVLRDQTVVVADGVITAIGNAAELEPPAGAIRIEAAGRWLMPGLADMHVHCWSPADHLMYVANGVTTVRNMWGHDGHLGWRAQADAREPDFLGPTFYTAGSLLDGSPPVWPTSRVLTDPEAARAEVAKQADKGFHFIKVYTRLEAPVYAAIVDAAAERSIPVVGHVPAAVGVDEVLVARQSTIEHVDGYVDKSGAPPEPEQLARRIEATRTAGTWNCVTLIVLENIANLDRFEELDARPELRYVSPFMRRSWNPANDARFQGADTARYDGMRQRFEHARLVTRALHEGGCRILLGTDAPNPFVVPGFAIHRELAHLVAAGLSPYEALRAGTSGASEYLGAPEAFGVVAVGARADLVLLEADPLEDVANFARRAGVMLRGRWFTEDELRARLEQVAESYAPEEEEEQR